LQTGERVFQPVNQMRGHRAQRGGFCRQREFLIRPCQVFGAFGQQLLRPPQPPERPGQRGRQDCSTRAEGQERARGQEAIQVRVLGLDAVAFDEELCDAGQRPGLRVQRHANLQQGNRIGRRLNLALSPLPTSPLTQSGFPGEGGGGGRGRHNTFIRIKKRSHFRVRMKPADGPQRFQRGQMLSRQVLLGHIKRKAVNEPPVRIEQPHTQYAAQFRAFERNVQLIAGTKRRPGQPFLHVLLVVPQGHRVEHLGIPPGNLCAKALARLERGKRDHAREDGQRQADHEGRQPARTQNDPLNLLDFFHRSAGWNSLLPAEQRRVGVLE
jgi:hypothetical protein